MSVREQAVELIRHPKHGDGLVEISNIVYASSNRVESAEGEYAKQPVDPEQLSTLVATDVQNAFDSYRRSLSFEVNKAIVDKAVEAAKECTKARVVGGRFVGNGHSARQEMAAKAVIAVAQTLDLT